MGTNGFVKKVLLKSDILEMAFSVGKCLKYLSYKEEQLKELSEKRLKNLLDSVTIHRKILQQQIKDLDVLAKNLKNVFLLGKVFKDDPTKETFETKNAVFHQKHRENVPYKKVIDAFTTKHPEFKAEFDQLVEQLKTVTTYVDSQVKEGEE